MLTTGLSVSARKRLRAVYRGVAAAGAIYPYIVAGALGSNVNEPPSADGAPQHIGVPTATGESPSEARAWRGRYLANAGNCVSCHTRAGAKPFSGGVMFETPFGVIYSSNITPDIDTGIGRWTADDLRRAMHEGIAAGGYRLFPAFPYTSFTKVTDEDVDAIYAYLRTIKAVRYKPPPSDFLFTQRWVLGLWNSLFFTEGRFSLDTAHSAEWNRGAYLVDGLGHCGACHTPRNGLMAESAANAYSGGRIQDKVTETKVRNWSAVNLTPAQSGLASWSVDDLTKYLKTGFSLRAGTFGPMNEVIVNSLAKLGDDDVRAIAVYLKSLPPHEYSGASIGPDQMEAGRSIYKERCEKCHSASGRGGLLSGPPLSGSAVVQADDPASLINIIIYGPDRPKDVSMGAWETMKPYGDVLNDPEIAALSNFIRGSWGNRARAVSPGDVSRQR
jgi:mono/diheme cytochrome c family protein